MERLLKIVSVMNKPLTVIAGCALAFVILVTVIDVVGRAFGSPIIGTYEMVCFSGAVLIGFSIPLTSLAKSNIQVDFLIMKFPGKVRKTINTVTKCLSVGLFFLIGWNLFLLANDLRGTGEVSPVLKIPFYPAAYGVGICSFLQCLVLLCDIVKILGEKDD